MDVDSIIQKLVDLAIVYGPKLILAILTLIVGLWVIKMIGRGIKHMADKREVDETLKPYMINISKTVLKVLLFVSVLGMIGIEMTSFIAILGAAGLAVGMALSGTLQNFASGIMILLFKPFKVGDFVELAGYSGSVSEIQIFNTILKTGDNRTIIIPNNEVAGKSMVNYSTEPQRRVDMIFGIGYSDDIDKARNIIEDILKADERILEDPAHFIAVSELADSSVNFSVKAWCNSGDYWGIYHDMQENVKKRFDEAGISIPFPHQDIYIHNT